MIIPLLITSCVGGAITINSTDGSKIRFKSENVSCEWGSLVGDWYSGGKKRELVCTANGVRTFLNGATTNYSDYQSCRRVDERGDDKKLLSFEENSFPCNAARKLGKY